MKSKIFVCISVFFIVILSPVFCMKDMSIQTLRGHGNSVNSVAFSSDGKSITSGSRDKTVKDWMKKGSSWECVQTLKGEEDFVCSVAFYFDGEIIVSGSTDKTIKIWRNKGGEWVCVQTLTGHDGIVRSVVISPDGKTLASGSTDKTIKIWRKKGDGWVCIQTLTGHNGAVNSVAFSPDCKTLVSGSLDYTIKIWENPLWAQEPIFTDLHSLNSEQQKKIKEMCKPTAQKNPFNDMKIFFEDALLDIEKLNEDVDKKKMGKY